MATALMVGAHNEECEYNCGGLTCLLVQKDWRVVFLNVIGDCSNWPMWPEGMTDGQRGLYALTLLSEMICLRPPRHKS